MDRKIYGAILFIQAIYTGMFLISKVAFDVGMNPFVFVFYRQAAATVFLAPIALFLKRKTAPPISFLICLKIFMLSLCGVTLSLNIYGVALKYTSATLAAATTNSLPVTTFILAVLLRMETAKIRTRAGIAKVMGIVLCAGGALTIAFFKGPTLKLLLHHHLFSYNGEVQNSAASGNSWIKGVFLMLLANALWATWLVTQNRILKSYPSKLLCTTLQCFMSTIQAFVFAIALARDPSEWRLGWNVKLLSVAYCGIVVTGVTFYLQAWVVEKKGPVYLAMTTPLALIFTIVSSAVLFGEIISLGSILGGILLVGGLYSVLWGKSREHKIAASNTEDIEKAENGSKEEEIVEKQSSIPNARIQHASFPV
ncbi:WAT1-related protein At5g64700 [Nicotiana tomentosiformis]|uniref:WAT1-related protein At5g64700 n=1 Tax=Nicotiana tomentosiformis TaxID=4098 RepID=UPI00051ABBD8|nr:WAT1-related protein At5g64700 [Nicotiana tomentosiformis]